MKPLSLPAFILSTLFFAPHGARPALGQAREPGNEAVPPTVVQLFAVGPSGEKNRACSATGLVVRADFTILTNAHVVAESSKCLKQVSGAKIFAKLDSREETGASRGPGGAATRRAAQGAAEAVSCDVIAVDEVHDLALLRAVRRPSSGPSTQADAKPFNLAAEDPPEGTPVFVTGHTGSAWEAQTKAAKLLRPIRVALWEGSTEETKVLVVDVPLEKGASGSPVYLATGEVIGVVVQQAPGNSAQTLAVPIRYALQLIARSAAGARK